MTKEKILIDPNFKEDGWLVKSLKPYKKQIKKMAYAELKEEVKALQEENLFLREQEKKLKERLFDFGVEKLKREEDLPCLLAEYACEDCCWEELSDRQKKLDIEDARVFLKNKKAKT